MNGMRTLLLCVVTLAGLPGLALANSRSGVRDPAGLFHADTIARANKITPVAVDCKSTIAR